MDAGHWLILVLLINCALLCFALFRGLVKCGHFGSIHLFDLSDLLAGWGHRILGLNVPRLHASVDGRHTGWKLLRGSLLLRSVSVWVSHSLAI